MAWVSLGPRNISGCIRQISLDPATPSRAFIAADTGGAWRLDSFETALFGARILFPFWTPLTDEAAVLGLRAVAVAPSNSSIIYIVTGNGEFLRSDNHGRDFRRPSASTFGTVRRLLVHPADAQHVYVAGNRGFHRSIDGGGSWREMATGDVTDAVMDPGDPSLLYIGVRTAGVRKGRDSRGATISWATVLDWSRADNPSSTMIKIAVGRQGTDATRRVVAKLAEEVFVNTAGGSGSWTSRGKHGGDGYPWADDWCHVLAVDPFDQNVILAGAQYLFRTANAGVSWDAVTGIHEDQQWIEFDPRIRGKAFLANDGGVYCSFNSGRSWQDANSGLVTGELDHGGISGRTMMSDLWHHGIAVAPDVSSGSWRVIEGGSWEGTDVYGDPKRIGRFYVFHSLLGRRTFFSLNLLWFGVIEFGWFEVEWARFRPRSLAVDMRFASDTLLAGTEDGRVMRLLDGSRGSDWTTEAGIDAGTNPIVALEYDSATAAGAYAASSTGRVFRKSDVNGSAAWERRGEWPGEAVRGLAVNALHPDRVYMISGINFGVSTDGGRTWRTVAPSSGNRLPPGNELRGIVAHPNDGRTVFVGVDTGVFWTGDEGQNWYRLDTGLPRGNLRQLFHQGGHLYAALYGRGLWRRRL